MPTPSLNDKIIFGLKIKSLRQEKDMLLNDLSKHTGISVSYLNEIEKAKKYPRPDKIELLAKALSVSPSYLLSDELPPKFAPVTDLLQSNFLQELPLELFGIDLAKIVEMVANAPSKVGAFISTMVDLSRLYGQQAEHFYLSAMRSYQEMYNNFFPELEKHADSFLIEHNLKTDIHSLKLVLEDEFNYNIIVDGLKKHPELSEFRSLYVPSSKTLLLNPSLNEEQIRYIYAKEIGFNYLQINDRPLTNKLWKITNFELVINNFNANYFATAVLIPGIEFKKDLSIFINQTKWNPSLITRWIEKYHVSPEVLFQRFNLLPVYLGLDKIFFLRVIKDINKNRFEIDKELHLSHRHDPQANKLSENYCRRWLSVSILCDWDDNKLYKVDIQRSHYHGTKNEYIVISIAKKAAYNDNLLISVTAGLYLDEVSKSKIKFLNDPAIVLTEVNVTCERCPIVDCLERAAPPVVLMDKEHRKVIHQAIDRLLNK